MSHLFSTFGWHAFRDRLPVFIMIVIYFLRLHRNVNGPKATPRPLRPPAGTAADGSPVGCDPDGRVWAIHKLPTQRKSS